MGMMTKVDSWQLDESRREGGSGAVGMAPARRTAKIYFALGDCWLGKMLVARTEQGLCAIQLGQEPEALILELKERFKKAELVREDGELEPLVAKVAGFAKDPAVGLGISLDVQGTAFQQQVWSALQQVPFGATTTYSLIAEAIGRPKSVRAVANACAANKLAIAIPCHRVIRTDGSLSGYRWGIACKKSLLDLESQKAGGAIHSPLLG